MLPSVSSAIQICTNTICFKTIQFLSEQAFVFLILSAAVHFKTNLQTNKHTKILKTNQFHIFGVQCMKKKLNGASGIKKRRNMKLNF